MAAPVHSFKQYLQGRGLDAAWWEESALDGALEGGGPVPCPWVAVRLGGQGIRRFTGWLRSPLKWGVRGIFLSPLLILLRAALAITAPWASEVVTVAFVGLVVVFFSMLIVYVFLLASAYLMSTRRPSIEPPYSAKGAERGGISLGGLNLPASALPMADARVTLRGRVTSLGDILPAGDDLLVRDLWLPGSTPPRRLTRAVDFAVVSEGQQPVVVRLESAPLLVTSEEDPSADEELAREAGSDSHDPEARLLSLRVGQEVEITGVPCDEIVNVSSFELGGRMRALMPEEGRPAAPYRSDAARPATLVKATSSTPVWVRVVQAA